MVIHANWYAGALLLWSDAPAMEGESSAEELRCLLGEASRDSLVVSAAQELNLPLWLPSARDGAFGLEQAARPALRFSPSEAIDLLVALPDQPSLFGPSIHYWQSLARFAIEKIRRRQFYPAMFRHGQFFEAAWRIVLSEREEVERVERFAAAMPTSCLAIVGTDPGAGLALVESFLHETADALVRRAASNDPFFHRVHSLAQKPSSQPEVRWLSALLGEDRQVRGDATENIELAEQVQQWNARVDESRPAARWQLGLRLIEPEMPESEDGAPPPEARWRLVFQLHAPEEEPVPADRIWQEGEATAGLLGRRAAERQALLWSELRRAAELLPPLARALQESHPTGVELTTAEAFQLIRQGSVQLRAQDFIVILPPWAGRPEESLELVMSLRPEEDEGLDPVHRLRRSAASVPAGGRVGLDHLLQFDWRVALGGVDMPPQEFQRLVSQQSPLVRHRGRWLQIDDEAARSALEFASQHPSGRLTLGDAFRTAFGLTRDRGARITLGGTSWIKDLLNQSPAAFVQELAQPSGFVGALREYQLRGMRWLAFLNGLGLGACLADDMGLGKTIEFIALLLHEREATLASSAHIGPTLVFAPTSVAGNWLRELERFAPSLRVLLHHGPGRQHGEAFAEAAQRCDVVITSYALAYRDIEDFRRVHWHRIALDEAQKIKNPSAVSSIAIRSMAAPHRVALTGTPIENHLSELWSIMEVLNPGLLGSAKEFRERFAVPIEKLSDSARAQELRKMIRPFVLRRTKNDPEIAGDLPDKMEMKVYCNLTAEQAAMYQRITGEMLGQIDAASGIRRRGLILAVLTRLKQICDHPALLTEENMALDRRSGKAERLVEMLEEVIEEGESALVFTQYRQMGHLLERMIAERLKTTVQFLHGGTPATRRDDMVRQFQDPAAGVRVFILSLRAGGLGLNLTAASHVFHYDRWWNPAVEAQATDRAHRIGQTKRVQVHKFISIGTVEERIDRLLSEKVRLSEKIVGTGDDWLTEMSTAELREYLSLSDQAVAEF